MRIDFSPPDITEAEIEAVADVLRSGWITTGPVTKDFEQQIAQWAGVAKAVCLSSATAALESALRLLGVGSGDEVITSAYTFTASASVICHVGATPVLIDTAPDQFEMDYTQLANAISAKTKVVIPVDIAGVMSNYQMLTETLDQHKALFNPKLGTLQELFDRVIVLADAAHSFGAESPAGPCGSVADFTAFSFHAVKNVTTAEGGALVWKDHPGLDNQDIYARLMRMSLHGQSKDALAKNSLGAWEYDISDTDFKCNMTDVAAAIGRSQLARYPKMLARRKKVVQLYQAGLDADKVQTLEHFEQGSVSSCHLFLLRLTGRSEQFRNLMIEAMAKRGVACNVHYKPLPLLTAYKNLGFDIADYPNSLAQYQNEITLPLYSTLTDEQVIYILESFEQAYAECLAAGV
ncbi:capsular polysaccharide biosynthesis protein [Actinomycetota bacterium]|nr:capsular polysaccharide biosynthesis protein [Actinomycetota bacterium]